MLHKLASMELSVVGNAKSIFSKNHGKMIDSFPTIRFNRGLIDNIPSQGSRWDYLATAEVNTIEYYNKNVPNFHTLIFTPKIKEHNYKIKKIKFPANIVTLDLEYSTSMNKALGSEPSTGFQILWYLNSVGNKNVNIFGFDWKETPTYYEKRNKGQHNFEKEKELCLYYVEQNGWKIY